MFWEKPNLQFLIKRFAIFTPNFLDIFWGRTQVVFLEFEEISHEIRKNSKLVPLGLHNLSNWLLKAGACFIQVWNDAISRVELEPTG